MAEKTELIVLSTFFKMPDFDLEEGLLRLCSYGKPSVSRMSEGWHCDITMFVQGKGVEFKIRSEFNEKSPRAAVRICYERLETALRDLGV